MRERTPGASVCGLSLTTGQHPADSPQKAPDMPAALPLEIIRSLGLRPVLAEDLGEDCLIDDDRGIVFIDTSLTIRQVAAIAARCLSQAVDQAESLLGP